MKPLYLVTVSPGKKKIHNSSVLGTTSPVLGTVHFRKRRSRVPKVSSRDFPTALEFGLCRGCPIERCLVVTVMAITTIAGLVNVLRDQRLLPPEQLDELARTMQS